MERTGSRSRSTIRSTRGSTKALGASLGARTWTGPHPFGEEAVSIIKEAWEQRGENMHDQVEREHKESETVERLPTAGASIKPGWAARIERNQYWIHLTLYQPVGERRMQEAGKNWSREELINDGIVKRGVTVEATTLLGRRALRIVEALHSDHPFDELDPPENGDWYG
jgi:hypothetical protein